MNITPDKGSLPLPILETLRDEIIALGLEPGALLERPALRERFGVSSTPLRDALLRLADEGLVEIMPQHATRVSLIDPGWLRLAATLRLALELEAVRKLALAMDARAIGRLREQVRRQAELAAATGDSAFIAADEAFGRELLDAAGMQAERGVLSRLSGQTRRLARAMPPSEARARRSVRERHAVLDAVEARRPAEAQAALRAMAEENAPATVALEKLRPDWFRRV